VISAPCALTGSPALGRGRRRGFAKHCFAPPQPAGHAGPAVDRGWGAFNSTFACFIFCGWRWVA
jgi:hypothetical protein